jgi:hypothetical protein
MHEVHHVWQAASTGTSLSRLGLANSEFFAGRVGFQAQVTIPADIGMTLAPIQTLHTETGKMSSKPFDPSRRHLFRQGAVIAGGAALGALMLEARALAQEGTEAQSTAKYQAKPHGKQECDGCMQFIPGKASSGNGTCKIVQGSISPQGWCMNFTPKS